MSGRRQIDIPRFVWFALGSELEGEPSPTGSPCALRIYQTSGKDLGVGVYVSMHMSTHDYGHQRKTLVSLFKSYPAYFYETGSLIGLEFLK